VIPFKDDNPTSRTPILTIALIAFNIAVFIIQAIDPGNLRHAAYAYGAIPHYLLTFNTIQPIHPVMTIFTSMFMHGGLLHLISNMLYLWIFGNNIEDRLGYVKFILFYMLCGIGAAYSHALAAPSSMVPMIGASGAVSGILGAYLILYPKAKVQTLIILGFYIRVVRLPAAVVIGFWIIIQFINGLLSKSIASQGGVAWFAHIGGFLLGIVLLKLLSGKQRKHYY
jgi:membrane associated rhomboid family serine protease